MPKGGPCPPPVFSGGSRRPTPIKFDGCSWAVVPPPPALPSENVRREALRAKTDSRMDHYIDLYAAMSVGIPLGQLLYFLLPVTPPVLN